MSFTKGFTLIELMVTVTIVGILTALAVPAYQDYAIRAQVAEGISLTSGLKVSMNEYYDNYGVFPSSANDLGISSSTGSFIESTSITPNTGEISATFSSGANKAIVGKVISLVPKETIKENLEWSCESNIPSKYLPSSCSFKDDDGAENSGGNNGSDNNNGSDDNSNPEDNNNNDSGSTNKVLENLNVPPLNDGEYYGAMPTPFSTPETFSIAFNIHADEGDTINIYKRQIQIRGLGKWETGNPGVPMISVLDQNNQTLSTTNFSNVDEFYTWFEKQNEDLYNTMMAQHPDVYNNLKNTYNPFN